MVGVLFGDGQLASVGPESKKGPGQWKEERWVQQQPIISRIYQPTFYILENNLMPAPDGL